MAGMEHIISVEEFHSTKYERKEAGEISRAHDQGANTEKRSITIHDEGSTSFEEDKFKKLEKARGKLQNQVTTKPKIRKVVMVHFSKNKIVFLKIIVVFIIFLSENSL